MLVRKWLLPDVLRNVLQLDVITGFTSDDFSRFTTLRDPVAVAWRSFETEDENWAKRIAATAKCSGSKVYARREAWLAEFKIDIRLPYAFYRELPLLGRIA